MINTQTKKGFSLLIGLSVIVIMSTVAILVMGLSGKVVHNTTDSYRKEQAVLLARSYTELAIMTVMSNDRSSDCVENINGTYGTANNGEGYSIRAKISYIGSANQTLDKCSNTRVLSSTVTPARFSLNIIVDVYVYYKELDNSNINNSKKNWTTYHKRTLQKI